jgi:hypothetical protein
MCGNRSDGVGAVLTCRWMGFAIPVILVLTASKALAFREYVPPQCQTQNEDFQHPERYRDCLLSLMQVEPAEPLRASGVTAYRLLAIIETPAMPIFIEFGHSPTGHSWLKLRSPWPDSKQLAIPITHERWSAISLRVHREFPFGGPAAAQEPTSLQKRAQVETICIPEGGIELEFLFREQVIRKSIDACDSEAAFAEFLLEQAVEGAGDCARNAPANTPITRRLLRCVAPSPRPSPPEGDRE